MSRLSDIEQCLKDEPETRSNDRLLIVKVWERQLGRKLHPALVNFILNEAVMPETITRARRKFQEDGQYLATKEVEEQRYQQFVDATFTKGQSVLF